MPHEPRNSSPLEQRAALSPARTTSPAAALARHLLFIWLATARSQSAKPHRMQIMYVWRKDSDSCNSFARLESTESSAANGAKRRRRPLPIDLNGPESACGRAINSPLHLHTSHTLKHPLWMRAPCHLGVLGFSICWPLTTLDIALGSLLKVK